MEKLQAIMFQRQDGDIFQAAVAFGVVSDLPNARRLREKVEEEAEQNGRLRNGRIDHLKNVLFISLLKPEYSGL